MHSILDFFIVYPYPNNEDFVLIAGDPMDKKWVSKRLFVCKSLCKFQPKTADCFSLKELHLELVSMGLTSVSYDEMEAICQHGIVKTCKITREISCVMTCLTDLGWDIDTKAQGKSYKFSNKSSGYKFKFRDLLTFEKTHKGKCLEVERALLSVIGTEGGLSQFVDL